MLSFSSGKYTSNGAKMPFIYFLKIREICFEFFTGKQMKIDQKLKKDAEIYIRKNSKKILGGYSDGRNDKRIQTKNVS